MTQNLPGFSILEELLRWLTGFAVLYPELHYVFRFFPFSRYRIRQPEIVFDAPFRVDPGRRLPVMLLIKDADKFPVAVKEVEIQFVNLDNPQGGSVVYAIDQRIETPWWHQVFEIDVPLELRGHRVSVDCQCRAFIRGKALTVRNDNFPGLSHAPLSVFCADESLPVFEGWVHGDMHYHTSYTTDQVEFGAPVSASVEAAKAIGLRFLAVTDHSYDLDDTETNYLKNDPDLIRWKKSRAEMEELNRTEAGRFVIMPGEEVTCANAAGRNVHLLVLNEPVFVPGSGDSAERWFRTRSELTIAEVLSRVSSRALALAAHPKEPAPFLEKLLIRRGKWEAADARHDVGRQVLNGLDNEAFQEGIQEWVSLLLQGQRTVLSAGNDAHGNFNRFRQIRTPMLTLHEKTGHQRLGWARTCVWNQGQDLNVENILESLRSGRAVITTGPVVRLSVRDGRGRTAGIGGTAAVGRIEITLEARSSAEFGPFLGLQLLRGTIGGSEEILNEWNCPDQTHGVTVQSVHVLDAKGYVRALAKTASQAFCYTNPVWLADC